MATRSERFTDSQKKIFASDITGDLTAHPDTGDILKITNETAVKQSLYNLITTGGGVRPFTMDRGPGVQQYLFDQADDDTANLIEQNITYVIERFEPRVRLQAVKALYLEQDNAFQVTITFNVINNTELVSLDVILYRVR